MHIAYKNLSSSILDPENRAPLNSGNVTENDDNVSLRDIDLITPHLPCDGDTPDLLVLSSLRQSQLPVPSNTSPTAPVSPILMACICTSLGHPKPKDYTVLLDSGASSSIVSYCVAKKLRLTKGPACTWNTAAGPITTTEKTNVFFMLPELSEVKIIEWKMHVVHSASFNYDLIIGHNMLEDLGIVLDFKTKQITWEEVSVPMHTWRTLQDDGYFIHDSDIINEATMHTTQILDAHYAPADSNEIVSQCHNLTIHQKQELKDLIDEYQDLFDGTLGYWKDQSVNIQLKPGAIPYHARAFPIPKSREETLKKEIDCVCQLGVLQKVNHSEWAAPAFIIPKKDGSVCFISDFRELNLCIKCHPYPIPKISDVMLKLKGFQYGTSLDLNMGYYHIELNPFSKQLCTIVLPWGKYEYQHLPMGLCNSPDIFQEKMGELMADLDFVHAYIDDLIILTKDTWSHHLDQLCTVFTHLQAAGLKINAKKSFFGHTELEYLGYWIT